MIDFQSRTVSEEDRMAMRALIRPVVLEMHRRKLSRLVIEKDGGQVTLGLFSEGCPVCEHDIPEGDWCPDCNREYKEAARAHDAELTRDA